MIMMRIEKLLIVFLITALSISCTKKVPTTNAKIITSAVIDGPSLTPSTQPTVYIEDGGQTLLYGYRKSATSQGNLGNDLEPVVELKLSGLPVKSQAGYDLSNEKFKLAAANPLKRQYAFAVQGYSDWAGIIDGLTRKITELAIVEHGVIESIQWSLNGQWLAVSTTPASGLRDVVVTDVSTGSSRSVSIQFRGNRYVNSSTFEIYSPAWEQDGGLSFSFAEVNKPPVKSRYVYVPTSGLIRQK